MAERKTREEQAALSQPENDEPGRSTMSNTSAYPAWQRRHEAVLQYVLRHPGSTNAEVALQTGYSVTHISRIVRAPEFSFRLRSAMKDAAALAEIACTRRRNLQNSIEGCIGKPNKHYNKEEILSALVFRLRTLARDSWVSFPNVSITLFNFQYPVSNFQVIYLQYHQA